MSPPFNFPPERYSAVYNDATAIDAVNCATLGREPCDVRSVTSALTSGPSTPPPSLFSCFHCAFRNGIHVLHKEKRAAKKKGGSHRPQKPINNN